VNRTQSSVAKILVVEDEADLRELLHLQLAREGYEVLECARGEEGLALLEKEPVDLILLDWMLPGMSGVDLARAIRLQAREVPILMLTARAEAADIVLGLEAGADDYITKPFESPVLRARIRALLRRWEWKQPKSTAPVKSEEAGARSGLRLNLDSFEAFCGEEKLPLTVSEFRLLQSLLENRGKVMTRNQLIQATQGHGVTVIDRAIDTHVFGLRKKLGVCADWIETVRGVGYRIKSREGQD
jgi:DNA-binding response OmpR family regulator